MNDRAQPWTRFFETISLDDLADVGGKNASLGEMYRELSKEGVRVPNGFAVTAAAYREFIRANDLERVIHDALDGLDTQNTNELRRRGQAVRLAILGGTIPQGIAQAIGEAYARLSREAGVEVLDVAVRSSATAEDLPDASFAGQQETFLNVQGRAALLDSVKRCFASLFTDRAISYRHDKGYSDMAIALSVGVQRMVRSDLAASGTMFSVDTETGHPNVVVIDAAWGLGENVVQGSVNPDEIYVFKPALADGKRPIVQRALGTKAFKLIYDVGGGRMTRNVPVAKADQERFCIDDDDVLALARWAVQIEGHYSRKRGRPMPMDMEWAKDGRTGELFILQARPETVHAGKARQEVEVYTLKAEGPVLLEGLAIGEKIATGPVRVVRRVEDLGDFQTGEVLVADKTDPDWEPAMKRAAAIVTSRGGRTCHAAIVSRELGVPAVVGAAHATERLAKGQAITTACTQGGKGYVYDGALPFAVERIPVKDLAVPFTNVMMNVANPSEALRLAQLPNDGVGLARIEFIIANHIKVHPLALVQFDDLPEDEAKRKIAELTAQYADKPSYFVDKLAEGVGMIAAAFYPKDVIVRLSDFKTNEYANLLGGAAFEPREENPMIGFRGASRYYDERYRAGFALECRALRKVRDEMGLANVKLMVPFCRTVDEGRRVLDEMARHGLKRGERGLEVYVMCEIPANVILAEQFAEVFDGFSIGSNDLTQLVLGVDRDSGILAGLFDERNPAVLAMIGQVIEKARASGRKIGICGQAPSDYPEIVSFLVRSGIDSISLNPDVVIKMRRLVAAMEESGGDR